MRKEKLMYGIIIFLCFISPLSVASANISFIMFNVIMIGSCFILYGIFFVSSSKIKLFKYLKKVYLTIYIPILFSIFFSFLHIFIFKDTNYEKLIFQLSLGRYFNICLYFVLGLVFSNVLYRLDKEQIKKILIFYLYGILIFIISIGMWQLLNAYFNIPMIKLNSRVYFHSVGKLSSFFKLRITGLANEPSYAVPFIIDGILISYILKKYKILFLNILILAFTFSGGGYINFIFVLLFWFIFTKNLSFARKILILIIFLFFLSLILIIHFDKIFLFFSPILNRVTKERNMFDISYNIRSYMVVMPFYWILEDKMLFSSFFGMGPGSYKYLGLTKQFYDGRMVHGTSNNLFSDMVYETGYVGFICLIYLFYWIGKYIKKIYKKNTKIYIEGAFLFWIHLIISSFYRADFFSLRFWIVLILVINGLIIIGKDKSIK